ncbi:MAG: alpha-D-ribose 1-methylphosphonate 5-triphosphate diphosphatase [Azospirillaceae bacterium]
MTAVHLSNARLVLPDRLEEGGLTIEDGRIASIGGDMPSAAREIDLGGDYLMPGLVELHTDHLEKHLQPRPGVAWPLGLGAAIAHDVQVAGAGITTVYDSLAIGEYRSGQARRQMLDHAITAVSRGVECGAFRVDHRLHFRCEISDPAMGEIIARYRDHPLIGLLSMMDHTPGDRQIADIDSARAFLRRQGWDDAAIEADLADRRSAQARLAAPQRRLVSDWARDRRLPLASHDDARDAHVVEAAGEGAVIAEFPTTLEAARAARRHGLAVLVGAPNLIRGESHSGNVAAADLLAADEADILSSDYVPAALLPAVFRVVAEGWRDLPAAVAMVTATPARVAGLADRGVLAEGMRADLIQIALVADTPIVRRVWSAGRRVA